MRLLLILGLGLCTACSTLAESTSKPSTLNKAAAALDGDPVVVEGWMIVEAEEVALWDGRADRDANRHPDRCVSLLIPRERLERFKSLNRTMVRVSGTFHKDVAKFHPTMFSALCNVSAVEAESAQPL